MHPSLQLTMQGDWKQLFATHKQFMCGCQFSQWCHQPFAIVVEVHLITNPLWFVSITTLAPPYTMALFPSPVLSAWSKSGAQCSRLQLPLKLACTVTIHRDAKSHTFGVIVTQFVPCSRSHARSRRTMAELTRTVTSSAII